MTINDPVGAWLDPLVTAASEHGINMVPLLQACATGTAGPERDSMRGINWLRYGRLLAEALGWTSYPPTPPGLN